MNHWTLPLCGAFLLKDCFKTGVCEEVKSSVCVFEITIRMTTPQINSNACIFDQHNVIASWIIKHRCHKAFFNLDEFSALNFKKPQIIKIYPLIPSNRRKWQALGWVERGFCSFNQFPLDKKFSFLHLILVLLFHSLLFHVKSRVSELALNHAINLDGARSIKIYCW